MPPKKHAPQKKACDVCYQRKIQCTFPNPDGPCEWCSHRNLECTFDRESPRKKRKTSDTQKLLERIEELKAALSQAEYSQDSTQPAASNDDNPDPTLVNATEQTVSNDELVQSSVSRETSAQSGGIPITGPSGRVTTASQLGPNWFFNGISISSEAGRQWISSRTDQDITGEEFCISIREFCSSSIVQSPSLLERCELPEKEVTQKALGYFFASSFRRTFPVLDQVLFESTIDTAYEYVDGILPSPTHISARACVFAALSITRRLVRPYCDLDINVNAYAAKAHSLLMHVLEDTSLTNLQTVLILQLHRVFSGDWHGAAFFHSNACRAVCSLNGHLEQSLEQTESDQSFYHHARNHTRLLFWTCYMLDKDISLRTGNPPILTDVYCDLTPPRTYLDHYAYLASLNELSQSSCIEYENLPIHFLGDPRLSRLKEKACQQLFSAQAAKETDNQLLLHIRQLDDEIESWRLSIPANFRPVLVVPQHLPSYPLEVVAPCLIRQMCLQLEYHHIMTIVHTTVRKCTADTSDGIRDLHDVVHSSFDLSLEASRSTMWCLKVLMRNFGPDAWRFIALYATTAAMSLFLNIVIHPYHTEDVQCDLELLISTAKEIRRLPRYLLMEDDVSRSEDVSDFIMKLVWLGTCAENKLGKLVD